MKMLRTTRPRVLTASHFFLWLLLGGPPTPVLAQKPLQLLPIKKEVPATEGYLGILTTPLAVVSLSGKENRVLDADRNGMAVFEKLPPGTYAYRINLADHHSIKREKISVQPGKAKVAVDRLKPIFSTLVLVMGGQAGDDVRIWINEELISPDQIEVRDGKLLVKRLQLPENVFHQIKIEKPYHEGIVIQQLIQLVECENFVSVDLVPLKGTLILSGNAGARIYLDGEDKGLLASNGELRLRGLVPREYSLRAELLGFASLDQRVTISPSGENRVEIPLEPLIEPAEITHAFLEEREQFFPRTPDGWQFEKAKSLKMEGAGLALLKSGTFPSHLFSIFQDFTMVFQVRQWDGGGIGWVVRASDLKNYYKFELLPSSRLDQQQPYRMTFCLYQNGVCQSAQDYPLGMIKAEDLRKGKFRVMVTVSKDKIWHCILSGGQRMPLGPTFVAPALARGGGGMSGVEGANSILEELRLLPGVFTAADCQIPKKPKESVLKEEIR